MSDTRLAPHEAEDLDVVLLGHSLGGIVAADVALQQVNGQFRNRILGLVNFDVPFLGLHPRVIPTGIGSSMPKKEGTAEDELAGEQQYLGLEPAFKPTSSPNFDPPFLNDVRLPDRGFFKGVMNFVNKNKENLARSAFDRVASTFKFAGCVNNYSELRRRYRRLKELEAAEGSANRVRFINYYTASTGRKKASSKKESNDGNATETEDAAVTPSEKENQPNEGAEGLKDDDKANEKKDEKSDEEGEGKNLDKEDKVKNNDECTSIKDDNSSPQKQPDITVSGDNLAPDTVSIPVESPPANDTSSLDLTSGASSISTSRNDSFALSEMTSISTSESNLSTDKTEGKIRKFILLPSHHWKSDDNSYWTPLVMKGIDEVEAHQTIFNSSGGHYEYLVGSLVALIENWVQDDMTRRLLEESVD